MKQTICDKCKKELKGISHSLKLDNQEMDLCGVCYHHIREWLDKPVSEGFLKNILKFK